MAVAGSQAELLRCLQEASDVSPDKPVVIRYVLRCHYAVDSPVVEIADSKMNDIYHRTYLS